MVFCKADVARIRLIAVRVFCQSPKAVGLNKSMLMVAMAPVDKRRMGREGPAFTDRSKIQSVNPIMQRVSAAINRSHSKETIVAV